MVTGCGKQCAPWLLQRQRGLLNLQSGWVLQLSMLAPPLLLLLLLPLPVGLCGPPGCL
jgi:hypothetical protein